MRPRILVVDDDPAVLLTNSIILQQNGYDVSAQGTLAEACLALENAHYDLLICDLALEHARGGFEVIDYARRRDGATPAILLTGFADIEAVREARQNNIVLVVKPVDVRELLATVETLAGRGGPGPSSAQSR